METKTCPICSKIFTTRDGSSQTVCGAPECYLAEWKQSQPGGTPDNPKDIIGLGKDYTGHKSGRLVALAPVGRFNKHHVVWKCRCECGAIVCVQAHYLANGTRKSCGCLRKEISRRSSEIARAKRVADGTATANIFDSQVVQNNNRSGVKGVCYNIRTKKWAAFLTYKRKRYHLGSYKEFEDAVRARRKAEEKFQDDFTGRAPLDEEKILRKRKRAPSSPSASPGYSGPGMRNCPICGKMFKSRGAQDTLCGAPECYLAEWRQNQPEDPINPQEILGRGKDWTGHKFGRLEVLEPVGRRGNYIVWKCRCECGCIVCVQAQNLVSGGTQSCGCLQKELTKDAYKAAIAKNIKEKLNTARIFDHKLWRNNTSGVKGVFYSNRDKKWIAGLYYQYKMYRLGSYDKFEDAVKARLEAEERFHEDFIRLMQSEKENSDQT